MFSVKRPMRNVIVGSFLLLCSLPIVGGGMRIASDFRLNSRPPVFLDVSQEPLWTTQVKRIDLNKQSYERLPSDVLDAPNLLASNGVSLGALLPTEQSHDVMSLERVGIKKTGGFPEASKAEHRGVTRRPPSGRSTSKRSRRWLTGYRFRETRRACRYGPR